MIDDPSGLVGLFSIDGPNLNLITQLLSITLLMMVQPTENKPWIILELILKSIRSKSFKKINPIINTNFNNPQP